MFAALGFANFALGWQRLALRLTEADCKRIGRIAAERGLASSGVRWLGTEAATEAWALESAGYPIDDIGRTSMPSTTVPPSASSSFRATRARLLRLASRPAQLSLAICIG